jgi:hypothetical protein
MSIERKDNITIVSGYWPVCSKHSHKDYCKWFENTLKINQRMYFFCDTPTKDIILPHRENLETIFVEHPISKFYSSNFYNKYWTHRSEIPSTELGKIWHEKINLMKLAKDMDGKNATDFYIWYDAGAFPFRNEPPPCTRLNLTDLNCFPHDKILYSDPYPSNGIHTYASTIHIIHRDLIDNVHTLYYAYLQRFKNSKQKFWQYGSDRMVLTELMRDYPQLFCKISIGSGENIRQLYKMN